MSLFIVGKTGKSVCHVYLRDCALCLQERHWEYTTVPPHEPTEAGPACLIVTESLGVLLSRSRLGQEWRKPINTRRGILVEKYFWFCEHRRVIFNYAQMVGLGSDVPVKVNNEGQCPLCRVCLEVNMSRL